MKKVLILFGLRSLAASLGIFLAVFLLGKFFSYSYGVQEFLGYLSIVLSLLFVFFALKYYRDKENQEQLSFKNGMLLGMGITLFVALGSAIADFVYVTVIYPDFITDYTQYQIESLRESVPVERFETEKDALLSQVDSIGHPAIMAFIMFVTVILLGIIITLISALLLQNRTSKTSMVNKI